MNTSVLASWWAISWLGLALAFGAYRGQKRYGLTGGAATLMRWLRGAGVIIAAGAFLAGIVFALVL